VTVRWDEWEGPSELDQDAWALERLENDEDARHVEQEARDTKERDRGEATFPWTGGMTR
jgi:hypothetical protein